ncbi:ASC1-like protein [Cryptomeria japonica]|uniref:ASC1-like protein n=1 Tax=Cryptomeria japonica TaxID=3369 RepID=UPI0025AD015E|nr:ASC1-like protein [Cryptomeria japonica]XP_057870097.1 ASC1-like protein [Cryptomeria japonica]XP_057870098.1 ASC1-like protein [Cryptomeria japonica]
MPFVELMANILQLTAWEDEAYPSKNDLLAVPLFALFFPAVRLFLDTFVLERLGRWLVLGSRKGLSENEIEDLKERHTKFKESAWKLLYYFVAESLALVVTYNEPWFTSTRNFWVGPGDQIWPDQKVKTKLKLLYMYVAGFYAYSIVALVFWETRRSDFGVSMSHHVATLILILASYMLRFSRVGSVVLAIHDASDVLLEVTKMLKYTGSTFIPSICFVLFAISWIMLRLVYFPFWIIWSTSYEVILCIDTKKHKREGPIYYYIFNTLLICLLVLHIYWWVLIYRMLERQMKARGRISEDVRSDSEDDKED